MTTTTTKPTAATCSRQPAAVKTREALRKSELPLLFFLILTHARQTNVYLCETPLLNSESIIAVATPALRLSGLSPALKRGMETDRRM